MFVLSFTEKKTKLNLKIKHLRYKQNYKMEKNVMKVSY